MKVNFKFSMVYEELLTEMSRRKPTRKDLNEVYSFTKDFEKLWRRKEKKIINSIEKNSGLKFKEETIKCYFVNHMLYKGISDPLTLRIGEVLEDMEIALIHELIHRLFENNKARIKETIFKKYPEEERSFQIHVPLLLIQNKVIQEIYSEDVIKDFKKKDKKIFKLEWLEVEKIKYNGKILSFLKK
jgi:hypothetical protein